MMWPSDHSDLAHSVRPCPRDIRYAKSSRPSPAISSCVLRSRTAEHISAHPYPVKDDCRLDPTIACTPWSFAWGDLLC